MYKTPNVLKAIMRGTLSLQDDEKVINGEVFVDVGVFVSVRVVLPNIITNMFVKKNKRG